LEDIAASAYREKCYIERLDALKSQINDTNFDEVQMDSEDYFDKFCDPTNPIKIGFNDISAAAYRIKGGIDNTPCTVGKKISSLMMMMMMEGILMEQIFIFENKIKSVLTCVQPLVWRFSSKRTFFNTREVLKSEALAMLY
jgi:hypothetical protein